MDVRDEKGRGTYTIDRIWKKSYFAKSLCGWCSCSYCDGSSAFLDPNKQRNSTNCAGVTRPYEGTKESYRPEIIDK